MVRQTGWNTPCTNLHGKYKSEGTRCTFFFAYMACMPCSFISMISTSGLHLWGMNLTVFLLGSNGIVPWTSVSVSDIIKDLEFYAVCHRRVLLPVLLLSLWLWTFFDQEHTLVLHFILQTGQLQRWIFLLNNFYWKILLVIQRRWNW